MLNRAKTTQFDLCHFGCQINAIFVNKFKGISLNSSIAIRFRRVHSSMNYSNILQLKLFIAGISKKTTQPTTLKLSQYHLYPPRHCTSPFDSPHMSTTAAVATVAADAAAVISQHCHRTISLFLITLEANRFYVNDISFTESLAIFYIHTQLGWVCFFLYRKIGPAGG